LKPAGNTGAICNIHFLEPASPSEVKGFVPVPNQRAASVARKPTKILLPEIDHRGFRTGGDANAVHLPEVLFEMRKVGKTLRVVAIDPITQTEVTMIAPAKASKDDIKRVAARKLAYVLGKKQAAEKDG